MSIEHSSAKPTETPPPAKRVRPNGYASSPALTKPFRTPLRTPFKQNSPAATSASGSAADSAKDSSKDAAGDTPLPSKAPTSINAVNPVQRPFRPFQARQSPLVKDVISSRNADPETAAAIREAQRAQAALATELHALKSDIDTLEQAAGLASATKDAELAGLVDKWRGAARQAAEEVFAGCRDRVNLMGGVGAWREREREGRLRRREWEEDARLLELERRRRTVREEEEESLASDSGDDEVTRERKRAKREGRWVGHEGLGVDGDGDGGELGFAEGEGERVGEEELKDGGNEDLIGGDGDDDDSFTMDMMLRQLGIDLDVIGYSKTRQMWVG